MLILCVQIIYSLAQIAKWLGRVLVVCSTEEINIFPPDGDCLSCGCEIIAKLGFMSPTMLHTKVLISGTGLDTVSRTGLPE